MGSALCQVDRLYIITKKPKKPKKPKKAKAAPKKKSATRKKSAAKATAE